MGRKDLCVAVPSFFRCPISLDVMKSPVSLCTGVTYDRASIQRWLDGGNNTCPATMQVLHSRDFVPNRTLQRLIEVWSESLRRPVGSSDLVPTKDQVSGMIGSLRFEDAEEKRLDMLSRIAGFARESEGNREYLSRMEDFAPMLVDLIKNFGAGTCTVTRIEPVRQALSILNLTNGGKADRERLRDLILTSGRDCLTAILLVLQRGELESRIESVRFLESIAIDDETKLLISEREGLLPELIISIGAENDARLKEASLSCMIALSSSKRVKSSLVRAKTVAALKNLLRTDTTCSTVYVTEKALKLLETLSCCKEGRSEICDDSECVQGVVAKVLKVSSAATENAVAVLWSVCYLFRDEKAREAASKSNAATKMLLLMQSNCSPSVRQMSKDLLKVFRVGSRSSCLSGYDTKTTHIMPF